MQMVQAKNASWEVDGCYPPPPFPKNINIQVTKCVQIMASTLLHRGTAKVDFLKIKPQMPNLSTEAALLPARLFFLSNLFTCILKGFSIKNLSFGRKILRRGRPLLSFYFNFLARETSCLVSNFEECWHSSVWTGCCNIRGIKDKMKRTIRWTERKNFMRRS